MNWPAHPIIILKAWVNDIAAPSSCKRPIFAQRWFRLQNCVFRIVNMGSDGEALIVWNARTRVGRNYKNGKLWGAVVRKGGELGLV